jgi:iron complex outermembrane receptor protein
MSGSGSTTTPRPRASARARPGNIRLEGLYIDGPPVFSGRLVSGSTLRVGIAAQGYPFPAPTGIADYTLRGVGRRGVSVNARGRPFGTRSLSLDTQQPLLDGRLGFAGGVATGRFEAAPGAVDEQSAAGGVLHWRASERLLIQPFFAVFDLPSLRSTPQVFTDGSVGAAAVARAQLQPRLGQEHSLPAAVRDYRDDSGDRRLDGEGGIVPGRQRAGAAAHRLLTNVQPDGSADRFVAAGRNQIFGSTSERCGPHGAGRKGRGGTPSTSRFGAAPPTAPMAAACWRRWGGEPVRGRLDLPEPVFAFGPQSQDEVRQTTIGVAYNGAWAGRGELRLGLQKADYQKTRRARDGRRWCRPTIRGCTTPALAATITSRLSAYAGYTVGLEESPVAPANAVNRNEAPPALRTSQRDAGIR